MLKFKKFFIGLEKKYKISAVLAPVTIMGEVLMEVFIPLIMARIIDVGIANHDVAYVTKTGLLMIMVAVISLSLGFVSARFAAVAALGFARNLRRRLFNKVQDFSFSNVDKFSTASLVTRLTTDVTNTQNTFQMIIRMCFRAPFMFISAIIMSIYVNARMSIVFIFSVPIIATAAVLIMRKAFPLFEVMMKKYDKLNGVVQENLTGIRAVKAFVREDHESQKFRDAAEAVRTSQVRAEKIVIFNMPVMMMVMYLSIIAILWFGGIFIIRGDMLVGELISFITYSAQILSSLMMISMIFVMLVISKASLNRISEVLDEEPDIADPPESEQILQVPDGSIVFKNVFFSYDKTMKNAVLQDVNLEIKSGQTVGIIGGTGSSKTTLVQLIPRLYDVLQGTVLVGGHDVKCYALNTLRSSVAMVLQKNVLFSGTIKENLCWGKPDASEQELEDVCKAACAYDFILSFPDGFDTVLGQGGVNLSGGQKQRLCIARALLKKPQILILDDSTSAVDTATDAKIRIALKNTLSETTKIVIAQRISSVRDADVIFVMDEGKITGFGTHDELLETNRIYKEVFESQQNGNVDLDSAAGK